MGIGRQEITQGNCQGQEVDVKMAPMGPTSPVLCDK